MTPSLYGHHSELPSVKPMPAIKKKKLLLQQPSEAKLQTKVPCCQYICFGIWLDHAEGRHEKRPSVLRTWYTIGIETASDVIKVLPGQARNRMRHTHHRSCFHSKRAHPFMLHSVCIAIVLVPALCVAGFTKLASMRSMSLMQRNNTPR